MKIKVRLYTVLGRYAPAPLANEEAGADVILTLPEGATAADARNLLGIPESAVDLYVTGGRVVSAACGLRDGDVLDLVPPVFPASPRPDSPGEGPR